jgi:hypothetical protein
MKLSLIVKKYRSTLIFLGFTVPIAVLLTWGAYIYEKDLEYDLLQQRVIGSAYYFKDARIIERQSVHVSKYDIDANIHLHIPASRAQEMVHREPALNDCNPIKPGCPEKTWQPYEYFVTSYGKSYAIQNAQGIIETRHNNPAVTNLSNDTNKADFWCTMFQERIDRAYGLCVNPASGDIWYHYYEGWDFP